MLRKLTRLASESITRERFKLDSSFRIFQSGLPEAGQNDASSAAEESIQMRY
jgi:hypothetical protein